MAQKEAHERHSSREIMHIILPHITFLSFPFLSRPSTPPISPKNTLTTNSLVFFLLLLLLLLNPTNSHIIRLLSSATRLRPHSNIHVARPFSAPEPLHTRGVSPACRRPTVLASIRPSVRRRVSPVTSNHDLPHHHPYGTRRRWQGKKKRKKKWDMRKGKKFHPYTQKSHALLDWCPTSVIQCPKDQRDPPTASILDKCPKIRPAI
jgi:hypothetical protein